MGDECVFCKIAAGEIPATKEYEDGGIVAFRDIHPAAPVHVLIIPKAHVVKTAAAAAALLGKMQQVAEELAIKLGVADGYQIVLNGGRFREVPHLHYHLKGGMK